MSCIFIQLGNQSTKTISMTPSIALHLGGAGFSSLLSWANELQNIEGHPFGRDWESQTIPQCDKRFKWLGEGGGGKGRKSQSMFTRWWIFVLALLESGGRCTSVSTSTFANFVALVNGIPMDGWIDGWAARRERNRRWWLAVYAEWVDQPSFYVIS